MAQPVAMLFQAAATQTWVVPADGIITGFYSGINSGSGLSWNPNVVGTDYSAPAATKLDSTLIINAAAGFVSLFVPVSKGELIFGYARGAGTSLVFFDDLS